MQPKRMPKIDKWSLLLVLAGIGKAQWVGGAEPIRPVVRQVPSIDKGTTVLLLYGKRWDLFKQEGLDLRIVVGKTQRRHGGRLIGNLSSAGTIPLPRARLVRHPIPA
jgi:hypothetical protein